MCKTYNIAATHIAQISKATLYKAVGNKNLPTSYVKIVTKSINEETSANWSKHTMDCSTCLLVLCYIIPEYRQINLKDCHNVNKIISHYSQVQQCYICWWTSIISDWSVSFVKLVLKPILWSTASSSHLNKKCWHFHTSRSLLIHNTWVENISGRFICLGK